MRVIRSEERSSSKPDTQPRAHARPLAAAAAGAGGALPIEKVQSGAWQSRGSGEVAGRRRLILQPRPPLVVCAGWIATSLQ